MGAIGNIIGKAIDAYNDTESGTTLQDFLSKFSSSDGKFISTIDPYGTFDVQIEFQPQLSYDRKTKTWKEKLGSMAKNAAMSAANNLTGGLVGSLMNSKIDVSTLRKDYPKAGIATFMNYLAAANLLVGSDEWKGGGKGQQYVEPLKIQLGLYCQEVTLPNIEMPQGGSSIANQLAEFPINGMILKTDSNILQMKVLNTKAALHERIFYPWMREVTLPYWSYQTQPYTTATITVDFTKHNTCKYVFCGCRPVKIMSMQATQDASTQNITRDISMLFDYMFIKSSLKVAELPKDKLMSSGMTLLNSATKMMGG